MNTFERAVDRLDWLVALVVFVITAGQAYYTVGVYPALIAAGAVVLERRPRMFWAMTAVVAITSAVALPASLPILTPRTLAASGWAGGGEQQLEMVGWPREVGLVASAYRSLPLPGARTRSFSLRTMARRERSTVIEPGSGCRRRTAA